MAVTGFNQLLTTMAEADFFTGILPFLLSYILFFLVIRRLPIMPNDSDETRKYSALISIVFAFFVANFIVQNPIYASFFTDYTGRIAVGLVGLLGFMVVISMIGWDMEHFRRRGFAIVAVLGIIAAFTFSGGIAAFLPGNEIPLIGQSIVGLIDYAFQSGLIWLLVIGGALYWVTTDSDSDDREGLFAPFPLTGASDRGWTYEEPDDT